MKMDKTGLKMREETRTSSYFSISKVRHRVLYTARMSSGRVMIQVNQPFNRVIPVLLRIMKLKRYKIMRIFLNKTFIISLNNVSADFNKKVEDEGYIITKNNIDISKFNSENNDSIKSEYVLICTLQRMDNRDQKIMNIC